MKRSRQLALLAIAQTPWVLVGCDSAPEEQTRQGFYTSVEACEHDGNPADVCQRAMQSANTASTAAAPRFRSKAECIQEYGDLCTEHQHESGIWMPLMTGFMISQMLSPGRAPIYLDSNPIYRTRAGQYTEMYRDRDNGYSGGGGGSWSSGSSKMRSVDVAPNRAITMSRSGFGSSSAARSGWGGRSSGG